MEDDITHQQIHGHQLHQPRLAYVLIIQQSGQVLKWSYGVEPIMKVPTPIVSTQVANTIQLQRHGFPHLPAQIARRRDMGTRQYGQAMK